MYVDITAVEGMRSLPMHEREEQIDEDTLVLERIRALILRWLLPTVQVGMGKGRATLPHKFAAACHALRLVSGSPTQLCLVVRAILLWLSDQGTERGIS